MTNKITNIIKVVLFLMLIATVIAFLSPNGMLKFLGLSIFIVVVFVSTEFIDFKKYFERGRK